MGKAVKTIGTVILVAGLAVATGGASIALQAGVGLAGAASLAAGTTLAVGGFSVSAGALIATGAILQATSVQQPQVKPSGSAIDWTADPDAPIPFAFGYVGVAGKIVHHRTFGPDRMYAGFAGVLSGAGPIHEYTGFLADDVSVAFDGNGKAISSYYANVMYMKRQPGAQPTTSALSIGGLKNGATLPGWASTAYMSGKAGYLYVLAENSKGSAYKGKVPTGIHAFRGLRCWDPRLDSTYPGGSGSCRLNNPATWVYTENAYLHALKWVLGLWEGPTLKGAPAHDSTTDRQVGGIGARVENVRVQMYVDGANAFEANEGWACAAWPDTDDGKAQVLDSFLQAGGGIYAQVRGKYGCIQRIAPRASVATITGADTAGPIELTLATPRKDRINTLRPKYWSPLHRFQMTPAGEVTSTVWQEEDGQGSPVKRTRGVDYNYVPNPTQAVQLAALQIANTREGIKGVIPLRPYMMGLEVGDCFTITEPDFVLDGLKCLILDIDDQTENDTIRVSFVSESDGKYDFAYGRTPNPPPAPSLQPYDPTVLPPDNGDWIITPRLPGEDGVEVPIVDVVGEVTSATATQVHFEWAPTATGPWTSLGLWPPTTTKLPIDGLQPGQVFYVAVSNVRGQNYSDRTITGPYTAPGLKAGDVIPTAPSLVAIDDRIDDAFGELAGVQVDLDNAADLIATQGVEIAAARGPEGTLGANITRVESASVAGDATNATAISLVEARTDTAEASILSLDAALADEAIIRASEVSRVEAKATIRGNLLYNSTGNRGLDGWLGAPSWVAQDIGYGFGRGFRTQTSGAFLFNDNAHLASVAPGGWVTWSADPNAFGGALSIWLEFYDGGLNRIGGNFAQVTVTNRDFGAPVSAEAVAPAGALTARIVALPTLATGGGAGVRRLKIESGRLPATAWSDEETTAGLSAAVTEQSLALIDLETQQALAKYEVVASASGGRPARLRLVSSALGSAVALDAPFIYFGDNTVFDDATDTLQTTVGANIRVLALGAPFGASSNLVEWWGPTGTALSAMTTGNGLNGRMTTAPYVFDNVLNASKAGGYTSFSSGGLSASKTIDGVLAGSAIQMSAAITGGSLSADSSQVVRLSLYEAAGGSSTLVYQEDVTVTSTGLELPGGSFTANGAGADAPLKAATKTGSVTYSVTASRISGSSYVETPTVSATVIITPPA